MKRLSKDSYRVGAFVVCFALVFIWGCGLGRQITPRAVEFGGASKVRALGDGWFEAEAAVVLANISPEEARRRALQEARDRALAFAVGLDVQRLAVDYVRGGENSYKEAFLALSQVSSAGRIVAERPPHWETIPVTSTTYPTLAYRARLQVEVEAEKGEPDPGFEVKVELNQPVFKDGDEMELAITSTRACYVTVFCLTAADTAVVLLPHKMRRERYLAPGAVMELPDAAEKEMGIRYRVEVPAGAELGIETIRVVATKDEVDFGYGPAVVSGADQVPTHRETLWALMRWLVQIPRNRRAEAEVGYTVTRD